MALLSLILTVAHVVKEGPKYLNMMVLGPTYYTYNGFLGYVPAYLGACTLWVLPFKQARDGLNLGVFKSQGHLIWSQNHGIPLMRTPKQDPPNL